MSPQAGAVSLTFLSPPLPNPTHSHEHGGCKERPGQWSQENLQRKRGEELDQFCGSEVRGVALTGRWEERAREPQGNSPGRREETELMAQVHGGEGNVSAGHWPKRVAG